MHGNMWALKSNIKKIHDYMGHNLNFVLYIYFIQLYNINISKIENISKPVTMDY